ncbi:MAG: PAS domain S-box protein [Pseudomonadota bacterium]|nr:PAS domain S-box protein [Pseudomonadota bacterium]
MLTYVMLPILVVAGLATVFAVIAWYVGSYPSEMLLAASAVSGPAVLLAGLLLYRQSDVRRAAQRSLRSAEARIVGFLESAMDPVIAVDEEQRIVLFNAAAEKTFGWPRAAVLGRPLDMLIPQRYRDRHARHVTDFAHTGVTSRRMGSDLVLTGLRANGEEFPIDASISQHQEADRKLLTVILRDITARVQSERQLVESEARLRGIVDSAMDAIITVNKTQHIVLFNAAAERMFGCAQADAFGASLADFIPARFRPDHAEHVRRFGHTGTTSRRMGGTRIVTGLRRTGEEFPIDATISQLDAHGEKFYTVILRDVSERVAADDALRQSKEELKELAIANTSAREQEKSRIARELHDELAQALSTLKMEISLIRVATAPDSAKDLLPRLARMEQRIDSTIAAMRRIAADLRPLTLDELGLLPAVEALCEDFAQQTGIACELAVGQPDFELNDTQATAVFRIVQEALTNIGKHAQATQVEVTLNVENDAMVVSIIDNGVGFAPDSPRKRTSYGLLGLRERAYLLGGEARVTSTPGAGTEVEVRLPLAVAEPTA